MITADEFARVCAALGDQASEDIEWAEALCPPANENDFARELIYVICNSGMKNTVARGIYDRVIPTIYEGGSAFDVFKHKGKASAIDHIWRHQEVLFLDYCMKETDEEKLEFLEGLPWIGGITKYHAAKNFGMQVAKPDVHLQRLADREGCTAQQLCERLAAATGLRIGTVDTVLWRACANGVLDSRTGDLRA